MAGRAFVLLYAHDTPLYRGLRMAERRVQQFAYNANRIGRSMLTLATATAAPMALSAKTFADFQDVMKEVQAVTGATGDQFDQLYEKAKRLGSTTSFTAGQVGEGMANLGRQGFKPDEIDAAIPSVLNLARATKTELGVAATIAAGTLRALGMEAREMPRVADVLTATANNSAQTLEELGDTMKYAAPIADEFGLSIEQTAKAIGVLANMQIKGTMAGTSLRKIMGDIANVETQEKLRKVGVEALNADGSLRPLGDTMVEIGQAMANMTNAERISFAQDLFGDRAYGAALKLTKGGFDDLAAAIDNAAGSAERTAGIMDDGLGGTIRKLMSALEGVQIAVGEALSEALQKAGGGIMEYLAGLKTWIEDHQQAVLTVAKLVAALAAFGATAIAVGASASALSALFGVLAMKVAITTTALKGLQIALLYLAANPMMALAGGLAAVGGAMYATSQHTAQLSSEMNDLLTQNDALRRSERERMDQLAELAAKEQLSATEMQTAKSIIAELSEKYGDLGLRINETTGAIEGMTEAQRLFNEEQARDAKDELKAAIAEEQANIREMELEMQADARWLMPWEMSNPFGEGKLGDAEEKDLENKEAAIAARHKRLQILVDRYKRVVAGDQQAITGAGSPDAAQAEGQAATADDIKAQFAAGKVTSDEAVKMNEEMQDRISEYRIQRIADEQQRTIAEINKRYDAEREKAKELGSDLSLVEKARRGALKTTREKHEQQKREEEKRQKEAAEASNKRMRDDIARIEIERKSQEQIAQVKAAGGPASKVKELERIRERELLERDRQIALREAKEQGLDPAIVNELYDARQALAEQQATQDRFAEINRGRRELKEAALAPTARMGSLEAYQAIARHDDPGLRVQENILRQTVDVVHNTARTAEAVEEFGFEEVDIND